MSMNLGRWEILREAHRSAPIAEAGSGDEWHFQFQLNAMPRQGILKRRLSSSKFAGRRRPSEGLGDKFAVVGSEHHRTAINVNRLPGNAAGILTGEHHGDGGHFGGGDQPVLWGGALQGG